MGSCLWHCTRRAYLQSLTAKAANGAATIIGNSRQNLGNLGCWGCAQGQSSRCRFQPLSKYSFEPIQCCLLSLGADMRRRCSRTMPRQRLLFQCRMFRADHFRRSLTAAIRRIRTFCGCRNWSLPNWRGCSGIWRRRWPHKATRSPNFRSGGAEQRARAAFRTQKYCHSDLGRIVPSGRPNMSFGKDR